MEIETKRRAVLLIVTIEIVIKEVQELIAGQDVAARVDHSAPRKIFIVLWIFATIQFVHHHFPNSVRSE